MGNVTRIRKVSGVNGAANGRRVVGASAEPAPTENVPPPPDEGYWAALLREGEDGGGADAEEGDDSDALFRPARASTPGDTTERDWTLAQQMYDADGTLELLISGANRGGLLVEWNSLRGFVPASQLSDFPSINEPQA